MFKVSKYSKTIKSILLIKWYVYHKSLEPFLVVATKCFNSSRLINTICSCVSACVCNILNSLHHTLFKKNRRYLLNRLVPFARKSCHLLTQYLALPEEFGKISVPAWLACVFTTQWVKVRAWARERPMGLLGLDNDDSPTHTCTREFRHPVITVISQNPVSAAYWC